MFRLVLLFVFLGTWTSAQQAISLSLSANGQTEVTLYRGWPLLLEASAFLLEGDEAAVEWPGPLRLNVRNAQGEIRNWELESLAATDGPLILKEALGAFAVWGASGEATGAIPDGEYALAVDHPAAGVSRRVLLRVEAPPDSPSAEQETLKSRLESRYSELKGDFEAALSILDRAL